MDLAETLLGLGIGLLLLAVYLGWLIRLQAGDETRCGRATDLKEEIMAEREVSLGFQTPVGGADFSATASVDKGVQAGLDVGLKPDMTAAVSGVGGAAAYTWLAAITGPWTPFVLLGVGLSWLAVRHVKEGKKGKAP